MDVVPQCLGYSAELGEGLYWHAPGQQLFWVDIRQHLLHCYHPDSGSYRQSRTADNPCWLVGLADGDLLLGCRDSLWQLDPATLQLQLYRDISHASGSIRLNDAGVDPYGRLWFGSMDNNERDASGLLYRLDSRGLAVMHSGYVVSNGPVCSLDGRFLYHTSSTERLIYRFALSGEGELGPAEPFIRFTPAMGYPDGMTTDNTGGLWVAHWGGGCVSRFNNRGELSHRLQLPCANITNLVFGGPNLNDLYISSARSGLSATQLQAMPQAGSLFVLPQLPFSGVPANLTRLTSLPRQGQLTSKDNMAPGR